MMHLQRGYVTVAIGDMPERMMILGMLVEPENSAFHQLDLARRACVAAQEKYGKPAGTCMYETFAFDMGEDGGRAAFEKALIDCGTPGDDRITHLRAWDEAERPVACIHFSPVPERTGVLARLGIRR